MTDSTYAHLLDQLAQHNFDKITPELRANILTFYGDLNAPIATKKKPAAWQKTQDELEKLRTLPNPAPPIQTVTRNNSEKSRLGAD